VKAGLTNGISTWQQGANHAVALRSYMNRAGDADTMAERAGRLAEAGGRGQSVCFSRLEEAGGLDENRVGPRRS
jgi:hypothetical protein